MKATEGLAILNLFLGVDGLTEVTAAEKAGIGKELSALIAHPEMFPHSTVTLSTVKRLIGERVAILEKSIGDVAEDAPSEAPKGQTQRGKHLSKAK